MPENTSKQKHKDQLLSRNSGSLPWLLISSLILIFLFVFSGYHLMRRLIISDANKGEFPLVQETASFHQPVYLNSIDQINGPFAVAVSQDGEHVYVTESKGERLVKVFDLDGRFVFSFSPPGTTTANRILTYIAVSPDGRVFVADQYSAVINIFTSEGIFMDAILSRDLTFSKWIRMQTGKSPEEGAIIYFDRLSDSLIIQESSESILSIPGPERSDWNPLGVRFDLDGNLLVTNIVAGMHQVLVISHESLQDDLSLYQPELIEFGTQGDQAGQFSFPNSVVRDNQGDYYISDGNNGRISSWSSDLDYQSFFGHESDEYSLNLPRGLWLDNENRLFIVDTVGQVVRVFDSSGEHPKFLFNMGGFGFHDGEFNFPNDICIDSSGRIFITDTGNDRISIWSD